MPKFRKKPVEIEAIQYLGVSNLEEALKFTGKTVGWDGMSFQSMQAYKDFVASFDEKFKISTLEGDVYASPGDWIIKGVAGEFYPCKPNIFQATYLLVE